jgi:hypothetical protein
MHLNRFSWVIPLVLTATGCAPRWGSLGFGVGVVTGATLAMNDQPYLERIVVVQQPPVLLAIAPPSDGPPPPSPRRFDATAAKVSLEHVDVSPCRALGLPRGYLHARATFDTSGAATQVVVDAPAGLSADTVACIGRSIGDATVPSFDGDGGVSVGASWFVP